MSIIDDIEREWRKHFIRTGKMPSAVQITETCDKLLCDEMERDGQWVQWPQGCKLKTMHGGRVKGVRVVVVPDIQFKFEYPAA